VAVVEVTGRESQEGGPSGENPYCRGAFTHEVTPLIARSRYVMELIKEDNPLHIELFF